MRTMAISLCRLSDEEIRQRRHWADFQGRSYLRVLAESLTSLSFADIALFAVSKEADNQYIQDEIRGVALDSFEGVTDRGQRLLDAAVAYDCDFIVYVPPTCPAFDEELTGQLLDGVRKTGADLGRGRRYPFGLVPMVITRVALDRLVAVDCPWPFYGHDPIQWTVSLS